MSVFLVSAGQYDDYRIVAAFSTREKAEDFINESAFLKLKSDNPDAVVCAAENTYSLDDGEHDFQIEEMALDSKPATEWRVVKDIGVDHRKDAASFYVLKTFIRTVDPGDPPIDLTQEDVDNYASSVTQRVFR